MILKMAIEVLILFVIVLAKRKAVPLIESTVIMGRMKMFELLFQSLNFLFELIIFANQLGNFGNYF